MGTVGYMSPEQASGKARRLPVRPVLLRDDSLRDGDRPTRLPARHERRNARPRSFARSRSRSRSSTRACRRRCAGSSNAASRRSRRSATPRRGTSRATSRPCATISPSCPARSAAGAAEQANVDGVSAAQLSPRDDPLGALRPGRTHRHLRRLLGRRTRPAFLDAAGEPRIERADAAGRGDSVDFAHGMLAISLERHWAGRFIWSGTLAQVPLPAARRASSSKTSSGPTGGPTARTSRSCETWRQDADRVPDRKRPLRDRRLGEPSARLAGAASSSRSSIIPCSATTRARSSSWTGPRRPRALERLDDGVRPRVVGHGKEIWFTATESASRARSGPSRSPGRSGCSSRTPGELTIQDASADGRILMTSDNGKVGIIGLPPGPERDRDLSLLDWSRVCDLSPDGKPFCSTRPAKGAGRATRVYIRRTDGSPAVQLGDGLGGEFLAGRALGRLADARAPEAGRRLLPVEGRRAARSSAERPGDPPAWWLPDGRRILVGGERARARGCDSSSRASTAEPPRPITPAGIGLGFFPVSPDGRVVVGQGAGSALHAIPIEGGDPEFVPGLVAEDRPIRFSPDGKALFAYRRGELPAHVIRLDLETGEKKTSHELMPPTRPASSRSCPSRSRRTWRPTPTATTASCPTSFSWRESDESDPPLPFSPPSSCPPPLCGPRFLRTPIRRRTRSRNLRATANGWTSPCPAARSS